MLYFSVLLKSKKNPAKTRIVYTNARRLRFSASLVGKLYLSCFYRKKSFFVFVLHPHFLVASISSLARQHGTDYNNVAHVRWHNNRATFLQNRNLLAKKLVVLNCTIHTVKLQLYHFYLLHHERSAKIFYGIALFTCEPKLSQWQPCGFAPILHFNANLPYVEISCS